jgi:hypothetical protein
MKIGAWAVYVLLLLALSSVGSEGVVQSERFEVLSRLQRVHATLLDAVPDVLRGERVLVMARDRMDDLSSDLQKRLLQAEARLRAREGSRTD